MEFDHRRYWFRSLFALKGSVMAKTAPEAILATALAGLMTWFVQYEHLPMLPLEPFTVLGLALGLLLTFRNNASYDRFWEGRKTWGCIVNRSRNLTRCLSVTAISAENQWKIARLVVGFAHSAKRQLWRETEFPELKRIFGGEEKTLTPPPGPAQRCLLGISEALYQEQEKGTIDSITVSRFEIDTAVLIDAIGICERIQKTPIPPAYVLHLRHSLVFYFTTLPLALVDRLGWLTPPLVGVVSYIFFGIERIGIELEDPFERTPNDLDLEGIANVIERDCFALFPASKTKA